MPRATALPARSRGLPSATTSSSPKPAATEAASDRAAAVVSACVRYGVSATVSRAGPGNAEVTVEGLIPGSTVREVTDGSVATRALLVVTFQPRASTVSAPAAPVSTPRSSSRLRPYSRTIGLCGAGVDGAGAPDAGSGRTNSSRPSSSTRTCAPLSCARNCRNSQSGTFAWESCWWTTGNASTRPHDRPAPAATWRTMSAVVMFRKAFTRRPRIRRWVTAEARTTVYEPVVSTSSSSAVTSPVNSRTWVCPCTVTTDTRSGVPMVMPVVARKVWSASRKLRTAVSGRPTLSSMSQETNWAAQAGGSGPGASTTGSAANGRPPRASGVVTAALPG